MIETSLPNRQFISNLVKKFNQDPTIFNRLGITSLSLGNDYIKWLYPSLDHPFIPNPYYLVLPYKIVFKNNPQLIFNFQQGENESVLEGVKNELSKLIIHQYKT